MDSEPGSSMPINDESATASSSSIAVSWREAAASRLTEADTASTATGATAGSATGGDDGKADEDEEEEFDPTPFGMYYGQLLHQQNMLQDFVRTGTYQSAIIDNPSNFYGKTVLDVGTGTGLLAFFAAHAGATKVYAVEASDMATHAEALIAGNGLGEKIEVVRGRVEEIDLRGEKVDVIVSEPLGFLLVHERMLESFVSARDRFLKPGGLMMPSSGSIHFAPFNDDALFAEQLQKAQFWEQREFYGINLAPLAEAAMAEYMGQAVVGCFPPTCLLTAEGATARHAVDFGSVTRAELRSFDVPFSFEITRTALMHGIGCWFDVCFEGSDAHVWLNTAPTHPATHWYQCRLLLRQPLAVNATQVVTGTLHFKANKRLSYDIVLDAQLEGTHITSTNTINLHNQMYHYLHNYASTAEGAAAAQDGSHSQYAAAS